MKKIEQIISSRVVLLGETRVYQPLPHPQREQVDPFLLLHHAGPLFQDPGGKPVLDVGAHPHRGFEPVTFVFQGSVRHRDSHGNDSVIGAGGVQWMTAGKGIIHSERLQKEFVDSGGVLEIIQLWINLPADKKMSRAVYQGIQAEEIPVYTTDDEKARIQVVAGTYNGLTGPVDSTTNVTAFTVEMEKGARLQLPAPEGQNAILYTLSGLLESEGDHRWKKNQLVVLGADGEDFTFTALEPARLLYVSGRPIEEEVVSYGPFVMNDQRGIMQAMRDYQSGKMGYLVEES